MVGITLQRNKGCTLHPRVMLWLCKMGVSFQTHVAAGLFIVVPLV
jgi:hypothetical protein